MSNKIKTKLNTIDAKLTDIRNAVLAGKRLIAYAIKFNGVETVNPYDDNSSIYDTFTRYAELIRRLKSANAMTLEFNITGTTAYKRSIVLPLYFGSGYAPSSINAIAQEIIAGDVSAQSLDDESGIAPLDIDDEMSVEDNSHFIIDNYGNECIDGNYVIPISDIQDYLTPEQQTELFDAIESAGDGYTVIEFDNSGITDEMLNQPTTMDSVSNGTETETEDGIAVESLDDEFFLDEQAEVDNSNAVYNYTVDWGDGSEVCTYTAGGTYEQNKSAMWHTYEKPGVYDVTINGNFRRMYSNTTSFSRLTVNGEYINDVDGGYVYSTMNYGMRYSLVEVITWGNTLLTNMANAFCYCEKLASIPMYDTTNSFADVTNFSYIFYRCSALKEIPFNANTNKGLFTGCTKATTFAQAFAYCTGMTGSIPVKLMDGCPNVTSVAGMFSYAKFTGAIPNGLLEGMTALTNASEMFATSSDNEGLSGEISADLFKDCPNVTSIYRLFYGCKNITGRLQREFIGGLSKLTDMRQAFYGCTGITGIDADAFYNIKADNINCRDAFKGCTGITEIPTGLIESMTGKGLMLERMFDNCTGITSLAATSIANLKVANARGMFGGCTKLASACPNANADWDSYATMKKWYGIFANTNLSNKDQVYIELGGNGNRKFPEGKVGMIVLQDKTYVEVKDYVYNETNKPIGVVYADVYLDPAKSIPTLANAQGNVVLDSTEGANHKIFVMTFSDTTRTWVSAQNLAEEVTTITNTSDVNVSYNTFTYSSDGSTQSLRATRYNGEAYSKALLKFIFEKGYGSNVLSGSYTSYTVVSELPTSGLVANKIYYQVDSSDSNHYKAYITNFDKLEAKAELDVYLNKLTSDRYPAITYCNTYNNGVNAGTCFLPDGADLWDMFTQKHLIDMACKKVIAGGGGFTTSNCLAMRDGTWYWASAEGYSTGAWSCHTSYAYVYYWHLKWLSLFVRPSFALSA